MRDIELYRHLLGIESPWGVASVDLSVKESQVLVYLNHEANAIWPCPECGVQSTLHDHAEERTWRHLDSCQFSTFLIARPPRVRCREHGVRQVILPWAEPGSRFTTLFERFAIDVLRETSVKGGTRLLRITWDQAWGIMERAVERGLASKKATITKQIGIDEKAVRKGHRYATLVYDIAKGTVEFVGKERKKATLDEYFQNLTPRQRNGIEGVAMDMWEPFVSSTKENIPDADGKIVFDRFHIMAHVGKAVDAVRRREHRDLKSIGDASLTGTMHLWRYAKENVPPHRRSELAELRAQDFDTGRAWAIRENLRRLWGYTSLAGATRFWRDWYFWATHSRLKPIIKAAKMIKSHLSNVLTYTAHPITNAVAEGVNSKIETIRKRACGIPNFEHFRTAVFFHCGGLNLYPIAH